MAEARGQATTVLEVSGVQWPTEKNVAEAVLSRRAGVLQVEANPVAQTATISYDPSETSVAELAGWVRDCGYHCAGQSVPDHICDPLAEPATHDDHQTHRDHGHEPSAAAVTGAHPLTEAHPEHGSAAAAPAAADHAAHEPLTPQEAMGHGGHHAAMS